MNIISYLKKIKYCIIYKIGVHFPYSKIRVRSLRALGYEVGTDVYFPEDLVVTMGYNNRGCLKLGDRVSIGPRCVLVVTAHPNASSLRNIIKVKERWITIGKDVWLGAGVVVLPEITIGEGAIIGAGSVVTKDIPAHSVAVGNPARVIKQVGESFHRKTQYNQIL